MKCEYLVLSSGGLKCLAFLSELEKLDLSSLKAISGSSAGALLGFLLCIMKPTKIIELLNDSNNLIFREQDVKLSNLFKYFGLNNGSHIKDFMMNQLHEFCGKKSINFTDFKTATNIDFFVSTTNMNDFMCEIFSTFNNSQEDVINSVMMSICIPFYFIPINFKNKYYIDGAFYNPIPISIIEESYKIENKKSIYIFTVNDDQITDVKTVFEFIIFFANFVRISLVREANNLSNYTLQKFNTTNIPFVNHKLSIKDYIDIIYQKNCLKY